MWLEVKEGPEESDRDTDKQTGKLGEKLLKCFRLCWGEEKWKEGREKRRQKGRAERRQCAFFPCRDLPCLCEPYIRVWRRQHDSKHTHTERCPLPNFTHSEALGNKQHDETQHYLCCSISWLRNSSRQCTHKHTHACIRAHTPPGPQLAQTNKSLFSEIRGDRLIVSQCSKNKPQELSRPQLKNHREATQLDLNQHWKRFQIFGVRTWQDLTSVCFLV